MDIHLVIMAGGSGTRFWPYSRDMKPKQFLDVMDTGKSLIQICYDRYKDVVPIGNIWVVSNEKYGSLIKEHLPLIPEEKILLEPEKKNTAPCIAYACFKIRKKNPNAIVIVCPSDQLVLDQKAFIKSIHTALNIASKSSFLLTIGIFPNRPETGYGYIRYKKAENKSSLEVERFTEKPHLELAKKFLAEKTYLWNSGIFIWSVEVILTALETHHPTLYQQFKEVTPYFYTQSEKEKIQKTYAQCESISIDYAVMEKTKNIRVVISDCGWSDLGSWNSLFDVRSKNSNNNVVNGKVLLSNCKSNFVLSKVADKIVVIKNLNNHLVADFDDVLLICEKSDTDFIKETLALLEKKAENYI